MSTLYTADQMRARAQRGAQGVVDNHIRRLIRATQERLKERVRTSAPPWIVSFRVEQYALCDRNTLAKKLAVQFTSLGYVTTGRRRDNGELWLTIECKAPPTGKPVVPPEPAGDILLPDVEQAIKVSQAESKLQRRPNTSTLPSGPAPVLFAPDDKGWRRSPTAAPLNAGEFPQPNAMGSLNLDFSMFDTKRR